ncbi:MAG TPA: hypothetical protein VHM92_10690 [Allosphingosinicella sp.]|nr:hypothetical protein [Allosphingosinicella sp.]
MISKPFDTPSKVSAQEGEVLVDGPNGFALSFTPEAAEETSDRLLFGAAEAKGQQLQEAQRAGKKRR